jgi:hypothetical protein
MLVSKLKVFDSKDWAGLTTETHLGNIYGIEPHLTSKLIDNIYDVNLGLDLDRFMDQFPSIEVPQMEYDWMLQGVDVRNYPLIEAYNSNNEAPGSAGFAQPGIAMTEFYLVFGERVFEATDFIVGEDTEAYALRVMEDPKPVGTNWEYKVQLITGDYNLFVPVSELQAGIRFSKEFSGVESTLSKRGGGVTHTSPFRMRNRLSQIRKQYTVPGNMIDFGANTPVGFQFKTKDNKIHNTWLGRLDWDFMTEFKREKAILLMYGKNNKTNQGTYVNKGESGYQLEMGSGLMEQISPSNIFYYNTFDLDYLQDILMSLSVGKLPEDSRRFVLGTGEYGWIQFHKAVEARGLAFSTNNAGNRITGSGNNLRFGGQYTKLGLLNGIEVELIKVPHFDDINREKVMHPDGGTLKSREYLIMDFGTQGGSTPNIQKVKRKNNEEIFRYIPGLRDPFSPYNNLTKPSMTVSSVDGYEVHKMFIGGVKVHNPMRMARLIPNIA